MWVFAVRFYDRKGERKALFVETESSFAIKHAS